MRSDTSGLAQIVPGAALKGCGDEVGWEVFVLAIIRSGRCCNRFY